MSRKLVEKALRILAEERRTAPFPSPPEAGGLKIALAYPHRYYTAMSNLGFQTVYRLFNEQPETVCERVFLPDPEELEEFRRTGVPLFSLENQRPVRAFDVLAFSLSYENDYPHLLEILELARIPLRTSERTGSDPLVLAGGATVLMNPEPLADFIDLFVIGEAEVVAAPLLEYLRRSRQAGQPREALLAELAELEGVYVPRFYRPEYGPDGALASFVPQGPFPLRVKRVFLKDLNASPTISPLVTGNTELSRMLLVELSRGCRRRCRFCASCYIYHPYRVRDPELLAEAAARGAPAADRIGLVGAAVSDYPGLTRLGRKILDRRPLSFSSLRVDTLTPEVADLVLESGQKTVTLAPESGSERLRQAVGKGFSEEAILQAVETLAGRGISAVRLYFMVGLPTERTEDVEAIIDLTKRIRHHLRQKSRREKGGVRITLSLNSFVPKPATPFQWHPFEEVARLKEKIRRVRRGLAREPGVTVAADLPKWAYLQSILSRGDRRIGKLLLAARTRGWNWPQAYREVDINCDFYVYRRRDFEELLPWDFIDHGVKKEFLWAEYQAALMGEKD